MMGHEPQSIRPFWSVSRDDRSFFEWVTECFGECQHFQQRLAREDAFRTFFYEGYQSARNDYGYFNLRREDYKRENVTKVSVNRTEEVIEQWVNRISRASRKLNVLPADSQEYTDRIGARIAREFLEHIWYLNDMQTVREKTARLSFVTGDAFVLVEYDRFKGDIVEGAGEMPGTGEQAELADVDGQPVTDEESDAIYYEYMPRTGDVAPRIIERRNLILQPGRDSFVDCDWCIEVERVDTAELLVMYPNMAEAIKGGGASSYACSDVFEEYIYTKSEHQTFVYHLYHRGTKFLDKGRYVKFTKGAMLENVSMVEAFGHNKMPIVHFPCFPCFGYPYSRSLVDKLVMLQVLRNNTFSIMYANMALGAQVKWLINRASRVEQSDITNVVGAIHYSGEAPVLAQFRTIGEDLFKMVALIDEAIDRIAAIHDISRGEVPARADSGPLIAHLDELEARRSHNIIQKHDRGLEEIGKLILATAGAFYKEDQKRTIRIVGKGNQYNVQTLDITRLGGAYDVRVMTGTGLSDSLTGRIGQLKEIYGMFPDAIPKEQFLDLISLGDDDRFLDLTRVAIEAAEGENEVLSEGSILAAPGEHEEHELHRYVHLKFMQSPSFKNMPAEIQEGFKQHIAGHEAFMLLKVQSPTGQGYAMKIMQMYPDFPTYVPSSIPLVPQQPGVELSMAQPQEETAIQK